VWNVERVADERRASWLYLDQKDWINLARVRAGKRCAANLREAAAALLSLVAAGHVVTPFSESHVLETGGIGNPTKRQQVATAIILLSRRNALAPLRCLWAQEADALLRRRFGAETEVDPEPFGKGLAFALGFAEDDLTPPWPPDAPEGDIALAEIFAIAEPSRIGMSREDIERRIGREKWARFLTSTSQFLIKDRATHNEQDRLATMTLSMIHPALLHRAIALDAHVAFLEFLQEEGPWAVIREMPTLGVLTELYRVRYPDVNTSWTANDYHDVQFLSVALAYCSAACLDNRWGDLARRSEYILTRGAFIATGENAIASTVDHLSVMDSGSAPPPPVAER